MRIDVIMPQMGESIVEGTIIKWSNKIGEEVKADDTLLEISTDKVDSEIPSPATGTLIELLAQEGDTVEVGNIIAVIETEATGEPIKQEPETSFQKAEEKQDMAEVRELRKPELHQKSTPLARSIAKKENLTLDALTGTGYGGKITKSDVLTLLTTKLKPAKVPEPSKEPDSVQPESVSITATGSMRRERMDHIRKSIAEHMVNSVRTSPHVTSVHEADVTRIMDYIKTNREVFEQREGVKLTLTSFIAMAVVNALKKFPVVNASVDGDEIVFHREINLGIAVALENGLIVPVIRRAEEYNLIGLTRAIYDIAIRARNKKLTPDEVQGGTFSITNYGVFDTLIGTPIINQPQVAILGTGAATQKPVVIDQMIGIRWMMYLSLTYDHRLLDGAQGGQFLKYLTGLLEDFNPQTVL